MPAKTDNDYIAEYIRERHPSLLGADFALWKLAKMAKEAMEKIADSLKDMDWKEIAEIIEKGEGDNDEKRAINDDAGDV